jgi:FeS assembly SUF system protein
MGDAEKTSGQSQAHAAEQDELKARVIEKLRTIFDPEVPVNIYDLGLIYELDVQATGEVYVRMTLTAPNCPVAQSFPDIVQAALWLVDGVSGVQVELVWEPIWSQQQMTEAARLQLGLL